ncbi:MAG: NAD(P)-dependent oxidoreductase [Candidatus Omnitrophica bacterium]|nr:NAD(P)-dependent oxidoreductase [Candidatus Omnitrophota bacterium]
MKILITGATGFIGERVVVSLVKDSIYPVCTARKTSNVERLLELGVNIEYCDIGDLGELREIFLKIKPDIVIHSAAKVIAPKDELYEANVTGTLNVCKASLESGVKRLVYLSSVAVINGNPQRPLTDDMPYKATADYGETKIKAEKIVLEYREKGLPSAVIRPCIVYGENEPHALDKIFKTMKQWPIFIPAKSNEQSSRHPERSEGSQQAGPNDACQLVYVENVVDLIKLCMTKNEALEGTFISADKEILSLREIIKIIAEELGKGKVREIPSFILKAIRMVPKINDFYEQVFKIRTYDISRAVNILGYVPNVSTELGLRRTVKHWLSLGTGVF